MVNLIKKILQTERIVPDVILTYIIKFFYQNLFLPKPENPKILFIIGCQRSGTSLMNRIFTRDLKVRVYREASKLSSDDPGNIDDTKKLRLNSLDKVKAIFNQNKAPLIIVKPLVESQNILAILDYFPQSKALWMYRNYKDVAASNLKRFGINSGIRDIRYIFNRDPNNWRSEKVSNQVHSIISKYYSEDMNPHDAAALFWFARNSLFYELNLDKNSNCLICKYEDLVENSAKIMKQIYKFVDIEYNLNQDLLQEISTKSVGRGKIIKFSPEIESLCENLLNKLHQDYYKQQGNFNY